jgi:hypothetical protein
VAESVEQHQAAAGDVARKGQGILGWEEPVAPAPEDQRWDLQRGDLRRVGARLQLLEAPSQRLSIALTQRQLVVAIDECLADPRGVPVDVAQAEFDEAAWQHVAGESAHEQRPGHAKPEPDPARRERVAPRVDEHQVPDAPRCQQRRAPRDLAAERAARQNAAFDLQRA